MVKNYDNCSICMWDLSHVCDTYESCNSCPNTGDYGKCKCTTIYDGEECPYYVHCSDKYSKPHTHCNYCENGGKNSWFSNMGIESTIRIAPPSPWENSYRLEICGEQIPIEFCPKCGRKLQVD